MSHGRPVSGPGAPPPRLAATSPLAPSGVGGLPRTALRAHRARCVIHETPSTKVNGSDDLNHRSTNGGQQHRRSTDMHDFDYNEAVYESLTLHGLPLETLTLGEQAMVRSMMAMEYEPDVIAHAVIDRREMVTDPHVWVATVEVWGPWTNLDPVFDEPSCGVQFLALSLN